MPLHSADLRFKLVSGHKIRRKTALRSGIMFEQTDKVHRPTAYSRLHFCMGNIYQIRTGKQNTSYRVAMMYRTP